MLKNGLSQKQKSNAQGQVAAHIRHGRSHNQRTVPCWQVLTTTTKIALNIKVLQTQTNGRSNTQSVAQIGQWLLRQANRLKNIQMVGDHPRALPMAQHLLKAANEWHPHFMAHAKVCAQLPTVADTTPWTLTRARSCSHQPRASHIGQC